MAVKVMLAPAIAQRAKAPEPDPTAARPEPRPKRRPSSVYDGEGNEVYISLVCLKCHKVRPLSQFGLRKMADGAIRNQPWCRPCRAGASAAGPARRKRPSTARAGETVEVAPGGPSSEAEVVDAGKLAAQVVAALHGGRR